MKIKILHLYPDLLNLYGDRGNIECMRKRLMWRGIDAEVVTYTCEDSGFDLSDVDIVFIGGGSDREQKIVCHRLLEHKDEIRNYVEDNGVLVAVCGGYQLLGKYYKLENETIEGLDILNIYTEQGKKRLIGNIVLENDFLNQKIVGFENHGGRTILCNSNMKVAQVSEQVGIPNVSYFCRSFREYYGSSPESYRKGTGEEDENTGSHKE